MNATTVVRLSKVIGPTLPEFEPWRQTLGRGKPIRPLTDLLIATLPLPVAAAMLAAAARDPPTSIL